MDNASGRKTTSRRNQVSDAPLRAGELLTRDEARRIASNIAKVPELVRRA
jgi:hypothetical protein